MRRLSFYSKFEKLKESI